MDTVNVCETFSSVQGESTYAGFPCWFVRLAGCNLRCRYCDATHAYEPGRPVAIEDLIEEARTSRTRISEITGGEPLTQKGFAELACRIRDATRRPVLVETNGSVDISVIPADVIAIVDMKCPDSGACEAMDLGNLDRLRPQDELKFVIGSRTDYDWAAGLVTKRQLDRTCHAIFFNPVHGVMEPGRLGEWLVTDNLPVRLGIQLHRIAGMR